MCGFDVHQSCHKNTQLSPFSLLFCRVGLKSPHQSQNGISRRLISLHAKVAPSGDPNIQTVALGTLAKMLMIKCLAFARLAINMKPLGSSTRPGPRSRCNSLLEAEAEMASEDSAGGSGLPTAFSTHQS